MLQYSLWFSHWDLPLFSFGGDWCASLENQWLYAVDLILVISTNRAYSVKMKTTNYSPEHFLSMWHFTLFFLLETELHLKCLAEVLSKKSENFHQINLSNYAFDKRLQNMVWYFTFRTVPSCYLAGSIPQHICLGHRTAKSSNISPAWFVWVRQRI